jgi:hypothetical protein
MGSTVRAPASSNSVSSRGVVATLLLLHNGKSERLGAIRQEGKVFSVGTLDDFLCHDGRISGGWLHRGSDRAAASTIVLTIDRAREL